MATDAADPKASKSPAHEAVSDADSDANSSDSDSIAGDSLAQQPIEWLATARSKRSTAGNRMKSMLANETPADEDSDLELLFQEDEDDEGFTDKEADDGSDAQMESSDDEDENAAQDDLEGEKELERQAKEKKAAARKRKAQEAIPAKFRKKVRISQPPDTPTSTTAPRPPPRPKKKSERASWLPTEADRPTRASERKTTRLSKEQLHQQMIEREARRMKQLEIMEKKAKKLEAMKKPPMTQADRLREAAVVEKRNSKSLNRWEEAEKQREEERRAKLAALNNRRLEGPVVTFWTGIIDLSEVQLKHVGKMVSIEEKPKPKRKRPSTAVSTAPEEAKTGTETETGQTTAVGTATTSPKPENGPPEPAQATPLTQDAAGTPSVPETPREANEAKAESTLPTPMDVTMSEPVPPASVAGASSIPSSLPAAPVSIPEVSTKPLIPSQLSPPPVSQPISPAVALSPSTTTSATTPTPAHQVPSVPVQSTGLTPPITSPIIKTETQTQQKKIPLALMPDVGPRFMPPPNPHLAQTSQSSVTGIVPGSMPTPVFAPAPVVPVARPVSLTAPTAPPPVLSPVNPLPSHPSSTPTPPAMPSPVAAIPGPSPPPNQQPPAVHTTASFQPVLPPKTPAIPVKKPQTDQGTSKKTAKSAASRKPPPPPEPPEPEPPLEGKVTRSCIILQDFDEDAIKKPEVQTQILFGRKMNKLASKFEFLSHGQAIVANQTSKNHLILHSALSPTTQRGIGIPRQDCLITTSMHITRFRSSPKVISSGASCWAHGSVMVQRLLRAFRIGFFDQRLRKNIKRGSSAKKRRRDWPRKKRRRRPKKRRRRRPKKPQSHLRRSKRRRLVLCQRLHHQP